MSVLYELDHVFICTDVGAPEAELLIAFGLTDGSRNTDPGQGTANRRFFFGNAMIELAYVADAAEAASGGVRRTGLLQRWQQRRTVASPFGICLRPGPAEPQGPPFSAWAYHPSYFSAPIYLGTNSLRVSEPLLCYVPFGSKPDAREQPLKHETGFQEITALRVKGPATGRVAVEQEEVVRTDVVEFIAAEAPMMEIGFDGEVAGKSQGFGPALPLKLCW